MKLKRTHSCGELTLSDREKEVILSGWVHTRRDHGGVIFIDLRDRYGMTQVVFNPNVNSAVHRQAEGLRSEYVISIKGRVEARPQGMRNSKMKTGDIDILVTEFELLNESKVLPFVIEDQTDVSEPVRLKYRYLDLRRPAFQKNFILRHEMAQVIRHYLSKQKFLELETPFLIKSTPEGARDFVVPSRIYPGCFYALPQSPQLFKQLFMVSGFERYFQIVRCFRDEDLRADRQPEFTQVDIEMSFVDQEDVMALVEGLVCEIFQKINHVDIHRPFRRCTYQEAVSRYGVDRPDLRFGLELTDVTSIVKNVSFKVFSAPAERNGKVKAINLGVLGGKLSRKDFDDLEKLAKEWGAKGLAWVKYEQGQWKSPIAKYFSSKEMETLSQKLNLTEAEACIFVSDENPDVVNQVLGNLRIHLGKKFKLSEGKPDQLCWVTDFPMFELDSEENRYVAKHHPFTAPAIGSVSDLDQDPLQVISKGYDLVWNGTEIAGGSIRIHEAPIQSKVFEILKIGSEEAQEKFGFLLEALQFGTPPHGGIAFGFDRLCALFCGVESIREVIAFPKTQKVQCLMTHSPAPLEDRQLKELHLKYVD
ncbi:MAG: aspartate--tRNA ligase [Deltaproteobacteria bacterium]|nr:aspartate--tRNA ligase [Deltaproteobacteria bacterium]